MWRSQRAGHGSESGVTQQIIVSGGGGFSCGPDGLALDEFALSATKKARPKVCYIATAAGDSEEFIQGFYDSIGPLCEPTHLPLFLPPLHDPAQLFAEQDLIYVSGGSTANLLAVWRLHGIDRLLADAVRHGVILYGSSAGGLCWFEGEATDSLTFDGTITPMNDGLGFLAGSHSPHFDRAGRAELFAEMITSDALPAGIGIDEFAAVHFVDGRVHDVVASVPGHSAHRISSSARRELLPARSLVSNEQRLMQLIRSSDRVMALLRAVRSVGLEHWCIAAGTIRNLVWDDLHGYDSPTLPSDVDVLIYDSEASTDLEKSVEAKLVTLVPEVMWEVVNQATIHHYTGDHDPYPSIEQAMSRWADLVTAVGARLTHEDDIEIVAPAGLVDLFNLVVRPNLATPTSAAVYRERMATKGWRQQWPMLTIEGAEP